MSIGYVAPRPLCFLTLHLCFLFRAPGISWMLAPWQLILNVRLRRFLPFPHLLFTFAGANRAIVSGVCQVSALAVAG